MIRPSKRRIVLGIGAGIAAWKSAGLVRILRLREFDVRVVMTRAATEFISPLTFQALSTHPVHCELLDVQAEAGMGHIELARWADLVLIAPATADLMARLAHGLADDLLTTLCLATAAPLAVAPAMNRQMWSAPATVSNAALLRQRGVRLLGPGSGDQACGEVGPGRMLEPAEIADEVEALFAEYGLGGGSGGDADDPADEAIPEMISKGSLAGLEVLITAGPTREAIDAVRFISNHSSGKMGYAVARAAAMAGAQVVLISGPVALPTPPGVRRIDVIDAQAMYDRAMEKARDCDIFIAAAAVADYRPIHSSKRKIEKTKESMVLEFTRTPDIVAEVAALANGPFTVGFAAQTERVKERGRHKLEAKGLDMIAANLVGVEGRGFEDDHNALSVLWPGGEKELGLAPKHDLARTLVETIAERYREKYPD
ncbi:bifunctional phosphopantothenoylcysteine decarboxylase/phosphopantothenate--cysteine ligase CoaBC [Thioalkalivibrio sp. HK1]|uniref:bifunctional phosphopantothenoylcysteine decarboxylase/phosphopantothenate--cysteine ligase CoaBC n=1 Tax=Thioalkalivibrio sp. HK1 TaxID=1469245 RepID=UPI0004B0B94B|nr:bifunctional phosphopantothenoylcysteine decarboxylase/phosphopantothenate--cysteine ligase CoaBC [Thioalkalivibrio sp. HK1]